MTPTERYARNFAKVVYETDTLDCLSDTDRREISRIFNTFNPIYHDLIAEYPLWIARPKNITPRDLRRAIQRIRENKGSMFLFSHARIETYLNHLEQAQNGTV